MIQFCTILFRCKENWKKLASLSTIIPPARVHGETTREPRSILKKRLIQSLDKVLTITFQHKAALGLQYEDQNHARKSYRNSVVRVNNTVTFSRMILVFVL